MCRGRKFTKTSHRYSRRFCGGQKGWVDKEIDQIESEWGCRELSLAQPNVTVHRKENFSCLYLFDSHREEETAGSDSRCLCPTESCVWLRGWLIKKKSVLIEERVWIDCVWGKKIRFTTGCPWFEQTTCLLLNFLDVACCIFVPVPKPLLFTFASAKLSSKL